MAEVTDQPLLGTLRTTRAISGGLVIPEPSAAAHLSADEVRRLRAAVEQRVQAGAGGSVLGVTSAVRREGRSTVAANLAAALAEIGHRTVLVDLDLRSPSIDRLTGTKADDGLVAALDDPARVLANVQHHGRLAVLPAAPVASPTAVLGSSEFGDLLQRLRAEYDFVVLDTPAILTSADPTDLAELVDGFLVVAGAGRVQRQQLDAALSSADLAGMRVVGVVLNEVKARDLPGAGSGPSTRPATKRVDPRRVLGTPAGRAVRLLTAPRAPDDLVAGRFPSVSHAGRARELPAGEPRRGPREVRRREPGRPTADASARKAFEHARGADQRATLSGVPERPRCQPETRRVAPRTMESTPSRSRRSGATTRTTTA